MGETELPSGITIQKCAVRVGAGAAAAAGEAADQDEVARDLRRRPGRLLAAVRRRVVAQQLRTRG